MAYPNVMSTIATPLILPQVSFVQYVNMTATFRKKARATIGDGGTVSSGASGSSKGTKATALSEISNLSGGSSDGGMSVFSQRSAGTKSSSASGLKTVGSGAKFSTGVVPRAAIEGSAFVIPAQEVNNSAPLPTFREGMLCATSESASISRCHFAGG